MAGYYAPRFDRDIEWDNALRLVWTQLHEWQTWKPTQRKVSNKIFRLCKNQLVTTSNLLAAQTKLGRQVVRRCLRELERYGLIVVQGYHRCATLITLAANKLASWSTYGQPRPNSLDTHEPHAVEGLLASWSTQAQPPCKDGSIYNSHNSTPSHIYGEKPVDKRGKVSVVPISPEEEALVEYAKQRLGRPTISSQEVDRFVAKRRENLHRSDDEIRRDIDWFASHPGVVKEGVKSICRAFYRAQVAGAWRDWDRRLEVAICGLLSEGYSHEALASQLAGGNRLVYEYILGKLTR